MATNEEMIAQSLKDRRVIRMLLSMVQSAKAEYLEQNSDGVPDCVTPYDTYFTSAELTYYGKEISLTEIVFGHDGIDTAAEPVVNRNVYTFLILNGIDTTEKLLAMSEREVLGLPQFGKKSVAFLVEKLKNVGLTLRGTLVWKPTEVKNEKPNAVSAKVRVTQADILCDRLADLNTRSKAVSELVDSKLAPISMPIEHECLKTKEYQDVPPLFEEIFKQLDVFELSLDNIACSVNLIEI